MVGTDRFRETGLACLAEDKKLIYLTNQARRSICPLYIVSRLRETLLVCGAISREQ